MQEQLPRDVATEPPWTGLWRVAGSAPHVSPLGFMDSSRVESSGFCRRDQRSWS